MRLASSIPSRMAADAAMPESASAGYAMAYPQRQPALAVVDGCQAMRPLISNGLCPDGKVVVALSCCSPSAAVSAHLRQLLGLGGLSAWQT